MEKEGKKEMKDMLSLTVNPFTLRTEKYLKGVICLVPYKQEHAF